MGRRKYLVLFYTVCLLFSNVVFAQEEVSSRQEGEQTTNDTDVLWVWAKIISVDSINKTLSVKYSDFETGIEKEMIVSVDKDTFYENIKSIEELKPQDNVTIDYFVDQTKKNIAKYIGFKKNDI